MTKHISDYDAISTFGNGVPQLDGNTDSFKYHSKYSISDIIKSTL